MAAAASKVIRKTNFEKNVAGMVSRRWEARRVAAVSKCRQLSVAYRELEAPNGQLREKSKELEVRCGSWAGGYQQLGEKCKGLKERGKSFENSGLNRIQKRTTADR